MHASVFMLGVGIVLIHFKKSHLQHDLQHNERLSSALIRLYLQAGLRPLKSIVSMVKTSEMLNGISCGNPIVLHGYGSVAELDTCSTLRRTHFGLVLTPFCTFPLGEIYFRNACICI